MSNKLDPIGDSSLNMKENIAALISYIAIGCFIIFFLEKQSKFAKYHAMQAIILWVCGLALTIVTNILSVIPIIGILFGILAGLIGLAILVINIICIYKAYQGEWFELPIIGQIAMKQVEK